MLRIVAFMIVLVGLALGQELWYSLEEMGGLCYAIHGRDGVVVETDNFYGTKDYKVSLPVPGRYVLIYRDRSMVFDVQKDKPMEVRLFGSQKGEKVFISRNGLTSMFLLSGFCGGLQWCGPVIGPQIK